MKERIRQNCRQRAQAPSDVIPAGSSPEVQTFERLSFTLRKRKRERERESARERERKKERERAREREMSRREQMQQRQVQHVAP